MDSCITSPRCPVMVNCLPPRMRVASMKTMSPPAGVHTSPTETPGRLTRSSTSFYAQNFADDLGSNHELVGLPLGQAARLFAGKRGDFPLEVAHARFSRVAVNDLAQAIVSELKLLTDLESVLAGLLGEIGRAHV